MKITDYPSVQELVENNVFLVDGPNGTSQITAKDLAVALLSMSGLDLSELNKKIDDLAERMGGYTFYHPPLTEKEYEVIDPHETSTIYPIKEE